jgi:hypothetical protein
VRKSACDLIGDEAGLCEHGGHGGTSVVLYFYGASGRWRIISEDMRSAIKLIMFAFDSNVSLS